MAKNRSQQAAIAISMKKAGKIPKAQKGISVKTVSATDPYEVYKRELQNDLIKLDEKKRKKLKTLVEAKLKNKFGGSTQARKRKK